MALVLIFVFNWWILFLLVNGILTFMYLPTPYLTFLIVGGTFLILSSWVFLINSSFAPWVLKWVSGARALIPREKNKVMALFQEVQDKIQQRRGLNPLVLDVLVCDDRRPKAWVLGHKTLIVSRTLYETLSNEELKGVFAHQLGHLHGGDSAKITLATGLNGVSLTLLWGVKKFMRVVKFMVDWIGVPREGEAVLLKFPILFIGGVLQMMLWVFGIIIKIGDKTLGLLFSYVMRAAEFKADEFAVGAGFGPGLLSFLEKTKNLDYADSPSLFDRFYETEPKTILRIGKIETRIQDLRT